MIRLVSISVAVLGLVTSVASLRGQERRAPEKLKPGASCATKECHGNLTARAVVHKPLTKKPCEVCHEQDDETLHKFTYPDAGSELCYGCHKSATKNKKFIHAPLKDKKKPCLRCHDPHSTATKWLVKAKTVSAQCLECHTELAKGPRYHKSRAVKGCTGCHVGHAADTSKFLRAAPQDLCYTCHEDIKEDAAEAKVVHGPLSVGCLPCHDPHKPMTGQGLRHKGAGLCMSCHEHFKPKAAAMSKHHPKLLKKKACRRCHEPHFSARKALLVKTPQKLCLTCHDKDIKSASGRVVQAMGPQVADGMHLHGPLAQGDCGKCHEPHGNERPGFLRRSYPKKFYSPYTPETYAFCFGCHGRSMADDKLTPIATKFRNGNVNLHYLHVNMPDKGRTCRACHASHGTKNRHMLVDFVRFGQWRLPIGYTETEGGGTCTSGCHRKMGYDRDNPVKPGATTQPTPTTKPASTAARAAK